MKRNDNTKSYSKIIFDRNMDGKNNTIDFSINNNNNNIILSPKNDYNNYTNKSNNFNPIIYTNTNYYTINRNIIAMEIVIGKMNGLLDYLNNPNKKRKNQV